MRWRPFDQQQLNPIHWLWLVPVWVVTSPFWAVRAAVLWAYKRKRDVMGPSPRWRPWFAWHPTRLETRDTTVWLEWVERRLLYNMTIYRAPPAARSAS